MHALSSRRFIVVKTRIQRPQGWKTVFIGLTRMLFGLDDQKRCVRDCLGFRPPGGRGAVKGTDALRLVAVDIVAGLPRLPVL